MSSEAVFAIPRHEPKRVAERLEDYFPGMKVRVDDFVRRYVVLGGGRKVTRPRLACTIMTPTHSKGADDAFRGIMRGMPNGEFIGSKTLVSLLEYLGTPEGMKHLAIPTGEDEVNLILGYAHNGDAVLVIYVEHEFENNVREIHIHARAVETWENDIPRALIIFDEDT